MFSSFTSQEQNKMRMQGTVMPKIAYNRCNFSIAAQTIEKNGAELKNPLLTIPRHF